MLIRNTLFIIALSFLGCVSQILSANDWAKAWVGDSITRIERMNERDGSSWVSVKQSSENRVIYKMLEREINLGKCYVDFIVDRSTGIIVNYRVYGDDYACQ